MFLVVALPRLDLALARPLGGAYDFPNTPGGGPRLCLDSIIGEEELLEDVAMVRDGRRFGVGRQAFATTAFANLAAAWCRVTFCWSDSAAACAVTLASTSRGAFLSLSIPANGSWTPTFWATTLPCMPWRQQESPFTIRAGGATIAAEKLGICKRRSCHKPLRELVRLNSDAAEGGRCASRSKELLLARLLNARITT